MYKANDVFFFRTLRFQGIDFLFNLVSFRGFANRDPRGLANSQIGSLLWRTTGVGQSPPPPAPPAAAETPKGTAEWLWQKAVDQRAPEDVRRARERFGVIPREAAEAITHEIDDALRGAGYWQAGLDAHGEAFADAACALIVAPTKEQP